MTSSSNFLANIITNGNTNLNIDATFVAMSILEIVEMYTSYYSDTDLNAKITFSWTKSAGSNVL